MEQHVMEAFKKVFEHLEHEGIKTGVDKKGVRRFVNECAALAALTGAVTGAGGVITMIVGVPVDVINNIVQQFRVTLAIIYKKRGRYDNIDFEEFMKIVGVSLGVEVGATITKNVLLNIAAAALAKMTASTAGKAVPIVGAFVSGGVNWMFIKAIAAAVDKVDLGPGSSIVIKS
jgi:hypothetical protein